MLKESDDDLKYEAEFEPDFDDTGEITAQLIQKDGRADFDANKDILDLD